MTCVILFTVATGSISHTQMFTKRASLIEQADVIPQPYMRKKMQSADWK